MDWSDYSDVFMQRLIIIYAMGIANCPVCLGLITCSQDVGLLVLKLGQSWANQDELVTVFIYYCCDNKLQGTY